MNRREELLRLVCAVESDVSLDARVWTPDDVVERATELLSEIDKRAPVERPSKLRELLADTTSADDGATLSAEDMVAFASEPVSAPVEDEDGPDVIRPTCGRRVLVSAIVRGGGLPLVFDDEGDDWNPFFPNEFSSAGVAAKAQAYWRANYRFAVDETFDEERKRVVKLPANQGRTPEGYVVTFGWEGHRAWARYEEGHGFAVWPFVDVDDASQALQARLRDWALANVPEGIEIVDGVPRYRETKKEPEAFFVSKRGYRWHFVETPEEWVAVMFLGGCSSSFAASDPSPSPVRDALRAYLDAKGVAWRKDGGA